MTNRVTASTESPASGESEGTRPDRRTRRTRRRGWWEPRVRQHGAGGMTRKGLRQSARCAREGDQDGGRTRRRERSNLEERAGGPGRAGEVFATETRTVSPPHVMRSRTRCLTMKFSCKRVRLSGSAHSNTLSIVFLSRCRRPVGRDSCPARIVTKAIVSCNALLGGAEGTAGWRCTDPQVRRATNPPCHAGRRWMCTCGALATSRTQSVDPAPVLIERTCRQWPRGNPCCSRWT